MHKVRPDGAITTVAGSGKPGGKGVSTGDGGLATEARLNGPLRLALDRSGNLFFSEIGDFFGANKGYRVRKVSTAGIITTVAGSDAKGFSGDGGPATQARLNTPFGLAVDSAGNLFIADWGNHRVRKIDTGGIITTIAGNGSVRFSGAQGLATQIGLSSPYSVAVDAKGDLLISHSTFDYASMRPSKEFILKVFAVAAPGLVAGRPFP
jgi:DNA-binding beta-propeller fold protein YncE